MEVIKQKGKYDCEAAAIAMVSNTYDYEEIIEKYDIPLSGDKTLEILKKDYDVWRLDLDGHAVLRLQEFIPLMLVSFVSPVSERDEERFFEVAEGADTFDINHVVAVKDGEIYDPQEPPYFDTLRELAYSNWEIKEVRALKLATNISIDSSNTTEIDSHSLSSSFLSDG